MRLPLTALAAVFALAAPASAASPDVVISQVYGGGGNAGATLKNDFIELYNRGGADVDLTGWSVQYASAGGTTWANRTPLTGRIRPGRYYLVQEAQGAGGTQALPTPNAAGTIAMSATAGKVALVTNNANLTCAADCDAAPGVRDFVGYGGANDFETAPTAPLTNTTAALRNGGGTVDTDDNAADFTVGAPNPRNTPPPVTVVATDPADGANDVPLGSDVRITFSGPIDLPPSAFTVACTSSGDHGFSLGGGPTEYTLDPAADFVREEQCTVTVHAEDLDDSFSFATVGLEGLRIHDIQGAQHLSPYRDRLVTGVPGVVTAVRSNGFYLQDPEPDGDDRTSEGIFVFTSTRPPRGTGVMLSGRVTEFRAAPENLSITELTSPTVTTVAPAPVPAPTIVGEGGRVPPNRVIDNDSSGDVDSNPLFDPQEDGIDFDESLEGMLVQFDDAVATGPTNGFGEVSVVADGGRFAGLRTGRGGVIVRPDDFNPERFILDDAIGDTPVVNTGDTFPQPIVAVADYSFGNFKFYPLEDVTAIDNGLQRETTQAPGKQELAIASFNVENLAPGDPPSKFAGLAGTLVDNLRAPDIVAVEEIQDDDGAANTSVTDASGTWDALIAAIAAAGGPTYLYRQIDPVDDQDGGQPGGNIRQGFLFRTDRRLTFVDRPGGTSTSSTAVVRGPRGAQLTFSPGRIQPADPAFTNSRKPLAGEFTWRGQRLIVVANHFNSKGGDDPLFGHRQPPVRSSEVQRHAQAAIVNGFAREIQRIDPLANVVVLGDINDFEFSETMQILQGFQLLDLMFLLPPSERYSYVFDGNSQALDHILVSPALLWPIPRYDSVHVNAEFADQQSDHDPQVARLKVD